MGSKLLSYFLTKLLTGPVLSNLAVLVLEYLAKRTDNELDDQLVTLIKEALK